MSRPILELYSREGESGDIRLEGPGPGSVKWARRVGEVLVGGSVVDFVESLGGAAFRVENPNAAAGCGCGSSFGI